MGGNPAHRSVPACVASLDYGAHMRSLRGRMTGMDGEDGGADSGGEHSETDGDDR